MPIFLFLRFFFFFFMIPPPPISTLFPYTTLFRSRIHELSDFVRTFDERCKRGMVTPRSSARLIVCTSGSITTQDRKSTRLNSSHSQISYAVFCLKKKKKRQKKTN